MIAKILPILNIVSKILLGLVLVSALVLNLTMAYIMFAPDTFPKPFYLLYQDQNGNIPIFQVASQHETESPTPEPTATPTPEPKPGEGIMLNTGTKIINLAEPNGQKYIRLTIVLEFLPDDPTYSTMVAEAKTAYQTTFLDELNTKLPLIDDTIITMLSTKTFNDLYTAEGKEKLRLELLSRIQAQMPDLRLLSLYFTEFVVD